MKFEELGYLSINDSLSTYIPAFNKDFLLNGTGLATGVSAEYIDGNSITVLNCLKEENGFGYISGGLYYYAAGDKNADGTPGFTTPASSPDLTSANIQEWVLAMINRGILGKNTGEGDYGGGANVLGAIAEKAYLQATTVEKSFGTLINEFIATPCGATVLFYKSGADMSDLPVLEFVDHTVADHNGQNYPLAGYSNVEQGGNAMWMTAADYGAVARMVMSRGNNQSGVSVMKPSTISTILHYKLDEPNGLDGAFGGVAESLDGNVQFSFGMVRVLQDVPFTWRGTHSKYNHGLNYWLGKWLSSQFMFIYDDVQVVVNEASKDGSRVWVRDLIDIVFALKK